MRRLAKSGRSGFPLQAHELAAGYHALVGKAPRRIQPYLSRKRTGIAPAERSGRRFEERLAMALFNRGEVSLQNDRSIKCLDYQFPLKAVRGDSGIGKIDVLGITQRNALAVIELKVGNSKEDWRVGLLEGLVYAAIVEANLEKIAIEVKAERGRDVAMVRPMIMLVAPAGYWCAANLASQASGFRDLTKQLQAVVPIEIELLCLDNAQMIDDGREGCAPRLPDNVRLSPVLHV